MLRQEHRIIRITIFFSSQASSSSLSSHSSSFLLLLHMGQGCPPTAVSHSKEVEVTQTHATHHRVVVLTSLCQAGKCLPHNFFMLQPHVCNGRKNSKGTEETVPWGNCLQQPWEGHMDGRHDRHRPPPGPLSPKPVHLVQNWEGRMVKEEERR